MGTPDPALPSIHSDSVLRRNLALDVFAAVGIGASMSLVGTLLPTVGRRAGMDPLGLAMLGAAPFLANALGMLAGRWGPRSPRQVSALRLAGGLALVALVLAQVPVAMIVVSGAFWLSLAFSNPYQARMWGAIYPSRIRGRMLAILGTGRAAAAGIAVFIAGSLAAWLGDVPALAAVGAIAAACMLATAGIRPGHVEGSHRFSARGSLRIVRGNPLLRGSLVAQWFYGGGLIAAAPLYALVQVDRLHLSLAEVGFIGFIAAVANSISFIVWGTVVDRRGGIVLLAGASVLGSISIVAWAIAPSVAFLYLAAVAAGCAGAGIDLGLQSVMISGVASEERAAVMAGWNALTGIRGLAAPFAATALVQVGLLSVTGALWLCAIVTSLGGLMYLRMASGRAEPIPNLELRRRLALLRA